MFETTSVKHGNKNEASSLVTVMSAEVTLEELEGFFVHLRLKLLTLPVWGPWGSAGIGARETS